jgi:hypothetical protein
MAEVRCRTPAGTDFLGQWREIVIYAFFDLADTIITVRSLVCLAWSAYRWDGRPARRP